MLAQPDSATAVMLLVGVRALVTLWLRGTSPIWVTGPVLAVVVASATWMMPKRQEKTAATDNESSATAA
ncbi:hypothetical protein [Yaniella halotolerans]|uniref:hypothetical protein n=1 Tax=Yaniella halotolerans TaxID=225453 RepID=UPI0003B73F4A|nr:hypothetical protein [Yaniella halotolerans]